MLVAGISTGNEIALAVVGGAFIVFALISSLVLPKRYPNFPGKNVWLYVLVGTLFVIAMLSSVIVFGKEKKEASGESPPPAQTTTTGTTPAPPPSGGAQGDATAGKAVFTGATAGCSNCHTLKDANSHGTIGPNLDQLKPAFAVVKHQVEVGGGAMPAFKSILSAKQIDDVAAYVSSVAGK
jgi:mono/diheme cytochrome c family protein